MVLNPSWLWGDEHRSDATLKVFPAGGRGEPVATLQVHTIILGSASEKYFQAQIRRWGQDNEPAQEAPSLAPAQSDAPGQVDEQQDRPAKKPRTSSAKASNSQAQSTPTLELTCEQDEPHGVPEAVIKHAYTGELPDDMLMLIWMVWRAEYLDMQGTESACLTKLQQVLSAGAPLTLGDITRILNQQTISQWIANQPSPAAKQLCQAISTAAVPLLLSTLGNTRQVLLDPQLLAQFVQLPFPLLVQWAKLESLVVDHENTLAVLFTAWYDHHSSTPAAPTPEQCEELSRLLNLTAISPLFYQQALPHLRWFKAPAGILHQSVHIVLAAYSEFDSKDLIAPMVGSSTKRKSKGPDTSDKEWPLTSQQLKTLWNDKELFLNGTIYVAGCDIKVNINLDPCNDTQQAGGQQQYTLGVGFRPTWPDVLVRHGLTEELSPPVVPLGVSVQVGDGDDFRDELLVGWQKPKAYSGWSGIDDRLISSLAGLQALMPAPSSVLVRLTQFL